MLCTLCKQREAIYDISAFLEDGVMTMVCDECLEGALGGMSEACPTCGWTVEDYYRTGLMGCADCYRAFLPLTLRINDRIQLNTEQTTRPPQKNFHLHERRRVIRRALEEALASHNYAKANALAHELVEVNDEIERDETDREDRD